MTSTLLDPRPTRTALPAVGPAWYGAVMGTAILTTLTQTLVPGLWVAQVLLVLSWLLLVGLTAGFAAHTRRHPGTLAASVRVGALPLWGMVSMGMLAVGSATAAVLPAWAPALAGVAVGLDAALWVLGTALGLATAVGFATLLVRSDAGAPTTVWGLAVVPPM